MSEEVCFVVFFSLCAAGIVVTLLLPERRAPVALAILGSAGAVALLLGAGGALFAGRGFAADLWSLPALGELRVGLDPLSGLFLFVTGLVYLPTSVFSAAYLRRYRRHYSLRAFGVLYFGLFASIATIVIARDIVSFLLSWELMSIASYLLVNYEHEREDNTRAGYLMLAMGEAGTLAAMLALLLLGTAAKSLDFAVIKAGVEDLDAGMRWAIFLLSLFGFGVKAGLVPFNSWLPRAHPVAPANVSALLSGVILNLGIYGIVRVNIDLLPATLVGPGLVALIVGAVSAFLGILYATTENDTKGMLAHSSIENMGIITAGLGAGFVFAATGHPGLAGIAFVAAFYHLTNHSIYKALLFLGAGTVDFLAGTRDLDRLGGLIHRMPWTALFFLVGALSIAAIYPFNGFASEWLTLQALLRSAELGSTAVKIVFALCGAGLAVTAALAVTCFVKAFAMGFLGKARSRRATRAIEAPRSMLVPMGALAIVCFVLGVVPTFVIATLDNALQPLTRASAAEALVPPFFADNVEHATLPVAFAAEFKELGAEVGEDVLPGRSMVVLHRGGTQNPVVFAMSTFYGAIVLILLLAVVFGVVRWLTRARRLKREPAWDGGVRQIFPEMTYTATGFSNPVRVVFDALLRPRTVEDTEQTVATHFRVAIRHTREDVHMVDRFVFGGLASGFAAAARVLARMHHGRVNAYVGYVLVTLIAFLILGEL